MRCKTALLLGVLACFWTSSHDAAAAEAEPQRLLLLTWGAPGEPQFKLELGQSGALQVVKRSLPITKEGKLTETRANASVTPDEASALINSALDISDFDKGCNEVADGTNAQLEVWGSGRHTKSSCLGARKWPQDEKMKALLDKLNSHLPKALHVF